MSFDRLIEDIDGIVNDDGCSFFLLDLYKDLEKPHSESHTLRRRKANVVLDFSSS